MNKCRLALLSLIVLFLTPAIAQTTRSTDTEKSVMTDEVYYLIPVEDDQGEDEDDDGGNMSGDDSSATQGANAKDSRVSSVDSSGTSSISNSRVMAPGGGGGGPGGGGSSGPDPLQETYARQNIKEDLTPYGVDLLGEQFDLATGSLTFNHTDVVLPGNDGLDVSIRRTLGTAQGRFKADNMLGDWELDVPKMEMMVSSEVSGYWQNDRCSTKSDPGDVYYFGRWYYNHEYWNGLKMHIPGQGAQTVLDNPTDPVKSSSATKKSTTQYWDISCTNVGGSEGFIATSPDGIKYHFDHLNYRAATGVEKDYKVMGRKRAQMFATKVEDRFGNYVDYTYSGGNLTKIEASDGRLITISYGSNGRIETITANNRDWDYAYTQDTYGFYILDSVTWPNGQAWSFDLYDLTSASTYPGLSLFSACSTTTTATGTVTHPYGAVGEYTLTETAHGRTDVPKQTNLKTGPCTDATHIQRSFDVLSLTQKKLTGPGLPSMTWDYTYSENQGGWAGDGTNPIKTTRVDNPDGTYNIHHFDRSWTYLEGSAKKVETFSSTGTLLQKLEYDYIAGPSRGVQGELFYENLAKNGTPKHQTKVTTTRGTDVFTTEYDFDIVKTSSTFSFGNPIEVDQYNSFSSHSQTQDIAYLHDKTNWELGRETTRKIGTETISENVYDTNNRVKYVRQYGVEVKEYSYNSNGTVAWQEDALNNRVTTTNWKRGIPQTITYPDSTTHVFVVDNNGWITKSTDANTNPTEYEFDDIGRMTRAIYPKGDGIQRLDKVISYGTVTGADTGITGAGLVSGQYKQTKTRGDFKSTTYFDAMLRPVLARSEDTGDSSLDRWTRQTFDTSNRPVFGSFPSADAYADEGTNTVFDALGRTVSATQDVSPFASTTYEYLNGNRIKVTNPRGKQTTTTYFALGSPKQDAPTLIEQPESITTTVVRNDFGEMTSATQAGTSPSVSATRSYYYDSSHRLCRQIDPETGSTAYNYNNNSQIVWYAKAASGSTTSCDLGSVLASEKVTHSYNSLSQLTLVDYADSSPDVSYSYDDNGNLETLNSASANWAYDYSAVNALVEEELVTNSQTFTLNYGFDTQDRMTSVTYPGSTVVSITPNAYGEPESVGSYATAIDYWPNGSIKQLDYGTQQGTGRIYTTTQNARQLPEKLKVVLGASTLADLTHSYDVNANITGITDAVNGSGFTRSMAYDDVDRLTSASGFWGTGSYSFDALGNILTKTESDIDLDYTYNSTSNLLTSIDDTVGTADYSFTYDDYGNVTNNGNQGFTYNLAGNLTSSTSPALSYKYDGHKRRVQKTEAGQTSYTVYGSNGKLLHKLKGGVATHYVYAGGLLIAELNGATVNYLHTDLLGSPIKGDNGTAYAEHYRPWGEKKDHPAQLADDVGYTGHQNDIATGLTYMQARYYDPVVGRFMAVDPLSFLETGDPLYFGRYGYAGNNPISYVDPTGRGTIYFGLDVWLASPKDTPAVRVTTPDGTVSEYKGATAAVGVYVSFPTFFGDDSSARFDVGGYVTRGVSTMDDPDDADKGGAGVSVGLDLGLARGDDRTFSGEGSAINADAMVVGGDILLDESGELLGANISGGVGLGYGEINTTTSAGGVRAVIDKIKDWWSK